MCERIYGFTEKPVSLEHVMTSRERRHPAPAPREPQPEEVPERDHLRESAAEGGPKESEGRLGTPAAADHHTGGAQVRRRRR